MSTRHFARFMAAVLRPGVLLPHRRAPLDVRRLAGADRALLRVLDDVVSDWLSWLEVSPRTKDDPVTARADFLRPARARGR